MKKLLQWAFDRGYDRGYNEALRDVAQAMSDRTLDDLEWELELLRI